MRLLVILALPIALIQLLGLHLDDQACDAGGPYFGLIAMPLRFDGTESGPEVVTYAWSFGDGASGSGATPTHTYDAPGSFTISLVTTTAVGAACSCATSAQIEMDEGTPPACDAGGPYRGAVGIPITFDGSGSSAGPGGELVAFEWSFGDGATGSGEIVQHAYDLAAPYTVTLVVTDEAGATFSCSSMVSVLPVPIEATSWAFVETLLD